MMELSRQICLIGCLNKIDGTNYSRSESGLFHVRGKIVVTRILTNKLYTIKTIQSTVEDMMASVQVLEREIGQI